MHKQVLRAGLFGPASLFCLVAQASHDTLNLQQQWVTATRTSQASQARLAASSLLDRQAIEQSQAQSLPELLQRLPGISLTNSGGPGKATSLFMRGTPSNHVLVLIDGVKAGSVSSGGLAWQDLPLELIERIEVVRGPRSGLYGSEAIGGVIQIFTRQADSQQARPFFSLGYGSQATRTASGGVSGAAGPAWYSLAASSQASHGLEAKQPRASGYEADHDGYRNLASSLRGGVQLNDDLQLSASLLQARTHNDFDGVNSKRTTGFSAYSEGVQDVLGATLSYQPLGIWGSRVQVGRSQDKSDNFQDGRFYSRFDSRRDSLSWQNDFTLSAGHVFSLGVDGQRDEINGSTPYARDNRDSHGLFSQYLGERGRHQWQVNLRRDEDEQFGRHDSGSLAYGYQLNHALLLSASYGKAYKAPTFNQLYYPGFGNPQLQPEQSRSAELGLSAEHDWGQWSLHAYRSEIDNLIATVTRLVNGKRQSMAEGVDRALIHGLEMQLSSQWQAWSWQANYSLIDTQNRSRRLVAGQSLYGKPLNRRPRQTFNLELDRALGRFSLGGSLHAQGASYDDLAKQTELAGFVTLDLRGEYRLSPAWRLQARLSNLLDADYQTVDGFNQPGRGAWLTLRYNAL